MLGATSVATKPEHRAAWTSGRAAAGGLHPLRGTLRRDLWLEMRGPDSPASHGWEERADGRPADCALPAASEMRPIPEMRAWNSTALRGWFCDKNGQGAPAAGPVQSIQVTASCRGLEYEQNVKA